MKKPAYLTYIFAIVGLGLLVGSYALYRKTNTFIAQTVKTTGTVIDLEPSRSKNSVTYKPVVTFKDAEGKEITFTSPASSKPPSFDIGETVEVLYIPTQPERAEINSFFQLWGGAAILGGMGAVVGLMVLVGAFKNREEEEVIGGRRRK